MSATAATSAKQAAGTVAARSPLPRLRRNPWGHPWFLEGFTWLYLVWSIVPIALAVLFSLRTTASRRACGRASRCAGTTPTR